MNRPHVTTILDPERRIAILEELVRDFANERARTLSILDNMRALIADIRESTEDPSLLTRLVSAEHILNCLQQGQR